MGKREQTPPPKGARKPLAPPSPPQPSYSNLQERVGNKGKHKEPRTLETKVKMAEVARKQWSNPESRAKKLIGMRKRKNNEKE